MQIDTNKPFQVAPGSGLNNLQMKADGSIDGKNLSNRELNYLYQETTKSEVYQQVQQLSTTDRITLYQFMVQNGVTDLETGFRMLRANVLKSSPLYDQVKDQAKGVSSRQLRQLALDPKLDPVKRELLNLIANAKQGMESMRKMVFQTATAGLNEGDPELEKLQKDNDEKAAKLAGGLVGADESAE